MPDPADILISVADVYVTQILQGTKTVELRRRILHIVPGTRVWLYAKWPQCQVKAVAIADAIIAAPPKELWRDFRNRVGVSLDEFTKYFDGAAMGCAVLLGKIQHLSPEIPLSEIRQHVKHFHPPQFFKKLKAGAPEIELFESRSHKSLHPVHLPKPPESASSLLRVKANTY